MLENFPRPERFVGDLQLPAESQFFDQREFISKKILNLLGVTQREALTALRETTSAEELEKELQASFSPDVDAKKIQKLAKKLVNIFPPHDTKTALMHPDATPFASLPDNYLEELTALNPSGKSSTDKRFFNVMRFDPPTFSYVERDTPAMEDMLQFMKTYPKSLLKEGKLFTLGAGVTINPIKVLSAGSKLDTTELKGELFALAILTVKRSDRGGYPNVWLETIYHGQIDWSEQAAALIGLTQRQQELQVELQRLVTAHNLTNPYQGGTVSGKG